MNTPPAGIITGASTGIGAATALEFASLGSRMVLASLHMEEMDTLVEAITRAGGTAISAQTDVRDPQQVSDVANLARNEFGRIDFLLANAGIAEQSSMASGDPVRWKDVVETNLLGAAYSVRYVLPHMHEQRKGHIFLMASISGRNTYVGEPLYIASKWGLVGLGHALRKEVSEHNIRVTLVEPGLVDTPLTRLNPDIEPLLRASNPLLPVDIARAIVYAFMQPPHVVLSELAIIPLQQANLQEISNVAVNPSVSST